MKIQYPTPKGKRIKKGTVKIPGNSRIHVYYGLESCENLYYCDECKIWFPMEKFNTLGCRSASSCYCRVHSVKAACRHIRKHSELPPGSRFRLISNFVNMDVYITKSKSR